MGYRFELLTPDPSADTGKVRVIKRRWWRDVEETEVTWHKDAFPSWRFSDGTAVPFDLWPFCLRERLELFRERLVKEHARARQAQANAHRASVWRPIARLPKARLLK